MERPTIGGYVVYRSPDAAFRSFGSLTGRAGMLPPFHVKHHGEAVSRAHGGPVLPVARARCWPCAPTRRAQTLRAADMDQCSCRRRCERRAHLFRAWRGLESAEQIEPTAARERGTGST